MFLSGSESAEGHVLRRHDAAVTIAELIEMIQVNDRDRFFPEGECPGE